MQGLLFVTVFVLIVIQVLGVGPVRGVGEIQVNSTTVALLVILLVITVLNRIETAAFGFGDASVDLTLIQAERSRLDAKFRRVIDETATHYRQQYETVAERVEELSSEEFEDPSLGPVQALRNLRRRIRNYLIDLVVAEPRDASLGRAEELQPDGGRSELSALEVEAILELVSFIDVLIYAFQTDDLDRSDVEPALQLGIEAMTVLEGAQAAATHSRRVPEDVPETQPTPDAEVTERLESRDTADDVLSFRDHLQRARTLTKSSRYEEADKHYQAAVALAPDNPQLRSAYASFLEEQGRNKEAEKQYREGLRRSPTDPTLRLRYADLLEKQGRNEEAEKQYQEGIDHAPEFWRQRLKYADLLEKQGRNEEAEEQYLKAIDLKPNNPDIRLLYSSFLREQGREREADEQYRAYEEHHPRYRRYRTEDDDSPTEQNRDEDSDE